MLIVGGNRATPSEEETKGRLRELGTELGELANAFTDVESTQYWLTLPQDNLREGMEFLKDIIVFPLFDPQELLEEKKVVLAEYDIHDANPLDCLQRKIREELFYEYPSRVDILGNRSVIAQATKEKLLDLKERYYLPNNSALIVTGDVEPLEAERLAKEIFGDWPKGDDPFKKYPVPYHPPLVQSQALMVVKPVSTITLWLSFRGPCISQDKKATYTSDVFCNILNNPSSSFQKTSEV
jgi:zinc protease